MRTIPIIEIDFYVKLHIVDGLVRSSVTIGHLLAFAESMIADSISLSNITTLLTPDNDTHFIAARKVIVGCGLVPNGELIQVHPCPFGNIFPTISVHSLTKV